MYFTVVAKSHIMKFNSFIPSYTGPYQSGEIIQYKAVIDCTFLPESTYYKPMKKSDEKDKQVMRCKVSYL
ncbi:unnamed protein product [Heterobilharzia americana]|nr:unnamed protein product [Heterobilharzia americana]